MDRSPSAQFHTLEHTDGRIKTVATFPVPQFHAAGDGGQAGEFEAIVSTFNTVVEGIFYDQMLKPGCFARTLRERGFPPVVWSHDWDTPPIGSTVDASETDEGLRAKGRLFVDDGDESPLARQVYTAMRAHNGDGRPVLSEFSIGFDIVEAEWEVHDENEILAISDVHLYEYGPCLVGRNVSRLIEVNGRHGKAAAATDPTLARFPRAVQNECAGSRALLLARERHI